MKLNNSKKRLVFVLVFLVSFIYLMWRIFFTLPFEYGFWSMVLAIVLLIAEGSTIIETFSHFLNVQLYKEPEMPEIPDEMYPAVDVLIATHNESEEILYRTLNGCKYMDYPDKSKIHIYLCDDKCRPEIETLAKKMKVGYFGVKDNEYAKAGNLNYALPRTYSPLIAIFDADMIPTSDFLLETAPYFFQNEMIKDRGGWRERTAADPKIRNKELGYVQTQQSFYNADVLQKNLYMEAHVPNEQDYFYRAVNVARGATESAAFAGSNTLFSRKALEDAGGLATYSITEDLATSIEILEQGYTSMAVAKELAHGLSPEDADSFIKQRKRWSRGSGEVIPKKRFIFSKLSLKTKWSFGVSYFYWWTFIKRFIYIICPILCGILGFSVAKADLSTLLTIWLPYYVIYNLGIKVMSDGTNSALWSSINDMIQFPYLIFPIIAGTLNIAETKFWVTPKDRVKGRNSSLRLAIPHIVLLILSIITIVLCIYRLLNSHHDGSLIILFWSVVNSYFLLNAIVYYYGRVIDADYDYIETDLVVTMYDEEREIRGKTEMISEKRLFVLLDSDTALDDNRIYFLVTRYKKYQARLAVKVISETARDTKKSYGLEIVGISEHDKAEYWQIIYDRDHPFSRDVNVGIIKNIEILVDNIFSSNEEKRV